MDFDKIVTTNSMKIGYVLGSKKVLYIKCGQGGSMYGYQNKYLNIARHINEKYGYSVFVSEIKSDDREAYEQEMEIIESLLGDGCEIYSLGVSRGGLLIIWHGQYNPLVKKMATVNAPLMINFHNRTRPAIRSISGDKLTMIYGTEDPSYKFVPFVESIVRVRIVEGANHHLVGGGVSLLEIVEELLET